VDDRLNWRMFGPVLMVCLTVYLFSAKGNVEISDTAYSLQTAQAIVNHGKLDIPFVEGSTLRGVDGRSYSKYGFGLPLYYIPWVATSNLLSRSTGLPLREFTGFMISFANIPFAILTLLLFAKLLKLFGVAGVYTWLILLGLGLGTLTWRYAVYDFSEGMQMCLLVLAVYGVARGTPKAVISGGLGFAALFLVKILYAVFFPLFLVYLLTQQKELRDRIRSAALFTVPFVLAGCSVAWLNVVRFGNPLESGYGSQAHMFFPLQLWHTVPELLGSLDKGLFIYCPILVLGIFGWKEFASRYRPAAVLCGGLIIGNLILAGAWYWWEGGWAWGPRFLVPTIPLWLLPAAFWFERRRSRAMSWILVLFTLTSITMQIPGILVKDNEIHVIKKQILTAEEQRSAPSNYVAACILLWHKLSERNELYRVSEFHIPGDRELNLTGWSTFIGLNIWTEQVARRMNMPNLRWLPLVAFFLLAYLAMKVWSMRKESLVDEKGCSLDTTALGCKDLLIIQTRQID
jgi:hypothetical protein